MPLIPISGHISGHTPASLLPHTHTLHTHTHVTAHITTHTPHTLHTHVFHHHYFTLLGFLFFTTHIVTQIVPALHVLLVHCTHTHIYTTSHLCTHLFCTHTVFCTATTHIHFSHTYNFYHTHYTHHTHSFTWFYIHSFYILPHHYYVLQHCIFTFFSLHTCCRTTLPTLHTRLHRTPLRFIYTRTLLPRIHLPAVVLPLHWMVALFCTPARCR